MKQAEIEVGKTYTAKVSGNIVRVKVLREVTRSVYRYASYGPGQYADKTMYVVHNEKTGREIEVTAARLRSRVFDCERCGKPACGKLKDTTTIGRPGEYICRECYTCALTIKNQAMA